MIREALNYPPSGEHGSRAVIVGGLLFVVLTVIGGVSWYLIDGNPPVVLVPAGVVTLWLTFEDISVALLAVTVPFLAVHIVLRGYYVAVLRASTSATDPTAPPFRSIQLVTDGLKYVFILAIYSVPMIMLGGCGLALQILSQQGLTGKIINTVGAFAFLLGLFAFIGAAYLVPAAITLFARENSLQAAFEFSTVRTCALSEDYAVSWVLATLMLIVFTTISILLQLVLVGFFLRFYLHVSVYHLYALSITRVLGLPSEDITEHAISENKDIAHA